MHFLAAASPVPLFVFFVGVILFIVVAASRHNKAVNEAWTSASRRLGLDYQRKKGPKGQRRLEGLYRGFPVRVNTFNQKAGNQSTTFTRFQVAYPDLGLGLELKHQHFFATLGRALTGGKDIVVGDRSFDDSVIVEAHSAAEVIDYLTSERRLRIGRLISSQRRAVIRDDEASFIVKGAVSQLDKFQRNLDTLVNLASCLADEAVDPLGEALEARRAGDLERALELVGEAREAAPHSDEDARLMHSELLVAAGRHDEARANLAAEEIQAEDLELIGLAASLQPRETTPPEPEPVERPLETAPLQTEAVTTPTTASEDIDYRSLRAELFESTLMSYQVKELFDERYLDHRPRWQGQLKRLSDYSSDMVFGGDAGTKATIALEPIEDGPFTKEVQAIVQLSREAGEAAKALEGETVTFTGRLVSCDGFMRNLFLADGELEG